MKLVAATAIDSAAMANIHAQCFPEPWSAAEIERVLQGPGAMGFVVRPAGAGAPIAFALAHAFAGEAELLTIAVAPEQRERGAGGALVEAVAIGAAAAGATRLFLEVAADNAAALALYAAAGFAEVGRRPRYYPRPGGAIDALVLRRELNSPPA